jgi:RNA polymerase sigma-70 factor (ECF subfamily)
MYSAAIYILIFILGLSMSRWPEKQELYRAIRDGDENAFRVFYNQYFDPLFLFLRNRGISPDVAKDLIQKAFIYVWEHRKRIEPEKSLKSYLYRIAYTRMLNYLDSKKETVDAEEVLSKRKVQPDRVAEYGDLQSALQKAVKSMPEKRRVVFESCFIQEMTYRETAEMLSLSVKTVEAHMALALRDVRKALTVFREV